MKLTVTGDINAFYVQTLCMIFFPGEKFVENETKKLLTSLYEEYNSDSVGFGRLIYILHKDFYKQNEKNLDSVLQNSIYEVEVDLKIRRMGHEFIT
jgi:hypothetical protein